MSLKVYQNPDKIYSDTYIEPPTSDNMLSGLHLPFSMLISGSSGVGKSNLIINIIEAVNRFKLIYLSHNDPNSCEYINMFQIIPFDIFNKDDNKSFKDSISQYPELQKLLIIDDAEWFRMTNRAKFQFSQLVSYISSHNSLSIIVTAQSLLQIPNMLRNMFQIKVIYNNGNSDTMRLTRRLISGTVPKEEYEVMQKLLAPSSNKSFIFIDGKRKACWLCIDNEFYLMKK